MQIAFVCHGNICRSPMAQNIFTHLAKRAGKGHELTAISRATSIAEYGHGIHPRAQTQLHSHGIPFFRHSSGILTAADYAESALIVCMDNENVREVLRLTRGDPKHKTRRLLDFTRTPGEIDDPWRSGDFERAYNQIYMGCSALLARLTRESA